jgi:hypothetical protein
VAGALLYAVKEVPTQYQATGQVLILLPPQATGPNNPTNPYMNLAPGLVTTATLIAEQLNNNTNHAEVEDAGFTSEYALGVVPDTGPLLVITTKDTDPKEAEATLEEVVTRVGAQLERMQANLDIPENQFMYTRRNDTNAGAEALPGSKIRAAGVLGGSGVVLTIVAAFLLDGFLRRRARRSAEAGPEPEEEQESPPEKARGRGKGKGAAKAPPAASTAKPPRPRVVPSPVKDDDSDQDRPAREAPARRAAGEKRR